MLGGRTTSTGRTTRQRGSRRLYMCMGLFFVLVLVAWIAVPNKAKLSKRAKEILLGLDTSQDRAKRKVDNIDAIEEQDEEQVNRDLAAEDALEEERKSLVGEAQEGIEIVGKMEYTLQEGEDTIEELEEDKRDMEIQLDNTNDVGERRQVQASIREVDNNIAEVENIEDGIQDEMNDVLAKEDDVVEQMDEIVDEELDDIAETQDDLNTLMKDSLEKKAELMVAVDIYEKNADVLRMELPGVTDDKTKAQLNARIADLDRVRGNLVAAVDAEVDTQDQISKAFGEEAARQKEVLKETEEVEDAAAL